MALDATYTFLNLKMMEVKNGNEKRQGPIGCRDIDDCFNGGVGCERAAHQATDHAVH